MKIFVLYHPESDHAGMIIDYSVEFEKSRGKTLDLVSLETRQGSDMAQLYDVTQYPAFLIITDDGNLQQLWQGEPIPLMSELSYYETEPQPMLSHEGHGIAPTGA